MSSFPSSSKKTFIPGQAQLLDRQNGILTPMMSSDRHSPSPSSFSATRLIAPRPFYRSQVTPDPLDHSNHQQTLPSQSQRRYSVHQINGLSNQESPSPVIAMHPQYRSTNNPKRALISVSSSQSPLITIASAGTPTRSEIRLSSLPKSNQSRLREICISRPDSPSISINRTATNGSSGAFRISLGTPGNTTQRDLHGRTSPSFYQMEKPRDSTDNRCTSNVVSHRFKPSMAYTSSNNNAYDRSSPSINVTPSPNESNSIGLCARCSDDIIGEENGLVAMDRLYHVSCFTCTMCGCRLRGMHFYSMENKPYCEPCYINSLEKCVICTQPITDRILRATGKPYHAQCFSCVTCQKSLDGVPFTVDASMKIHCIECFHEKFAPRCYACHRPILPVAGQEETMRVVALDRSYHIDCYRCEHCQVHFTSEQGCHPIDEHIFCLQCNHLYSNTMLGHA